MFGVVRPTVRWLGFKVLVVDGGDCGMVMVGSGGSRFWLRSVSCCDGW